MKSEECDVGVVNIILNSGSGSAPQLDMKESESMVEPEQSSFVKN